MSKQPNESTNPQGTAEQEARLYAQWEIAKKLYAAHRLLVNAPSLSRGRIVAFLQQTFTDFKTAGGDVQTGTDIFGQIGPILRCENGTEVPYEAGRMLADDYLSRGLFQ